MHIVAGDVACGLAVCHPQGMLVLNSTRLACVIARYKVVSFVILLLLLVLIPFWREWAWPVALEWAWLVAVWHTLLTKQALPLCPLPASLLLVLKAPSAHAVLAKLASSPAAICRSPMPSLS